MKEYNKKYIFISIVLMAFCLRIASTGIGSLLPVIQQEYSMSGGSAGLITTISLFVFALVSPAAGKLGHRFGEGKILCGGIVLIFFGTLVRSLAGHIGIFLGTAILSAGIALGNVLMPAVIKKEYPEKVGLMSGIFTVAMAIASTLALALSVPLANIPLLGWKGSLAIWDILIAASLLVWLALRSLQLDHSAQQAGDKIWKKPLAWCVTLFFGITSMMFYVMISWLPTILQESGMSGSAAGMMTSIFQLVGLPVSLLAPMWAGKCRDQRRILGISSVVNILGIIGFIVADDLSIRIACVILLGLSNGCNFSMALALFGFRSSNAADAARLSSFAQSLGYGIAATGPLVVGWLHDLIPNWRINLLYVLAFALVAMVAGLKAGENRTI